MKRPQIFTVILAACRRERYGSQVSRSASTRSVHDTGKSARMARGRRQRRVGVGDPMSRKDASVPMLRSG